MARADAATRRGFTPRHRGGEGSPLVCLHGFTDTWRTWELVLPWLERDHDVLAPTLPGHAGGPPLAPAEIDVGGLADAVERSMDEPLLASAVERGWNLDAERVRCPVRVVWGTDDRLLEWPSAAARLRDEWLPHADWVLLDGVGHCPQLDVPLETAQLIAGFTAR